MIFLRSIIFVIICLFFGIGLSMVAKAQTPAPTPEKQDPLQDSIDKYTKLGQYHLVVPFAEKWVEKCKSEKGEISAEYGAALSKLGTAISRSGKSKEVEPILLKALEIRKKALGEAHPDVAASLNSLGLLYRDMGNYPKSETYLIQALEIRKKALGEAHPDVAASLNNLGLLYRSIGNYSKAETYYLQALEIKKKALGESHPDVAGSMQNLGILYRDMGNYPKAEPYYLQALEIRKKALGELHPDVAASMTSLGNLYQMMGNYPRAEPYNLKALEIKKKALGESHLDVAGSMGNLGNLYQNMGNYPKAENYQLQALEIQKKALGDAHRVVALSMNNLGNLYQMMGNYPKAEPYQLQALEILKKALGESHQVLASSMNNLGNLYQNMGNYPKAEPYYLQALEIQKKALGDSHPDVAASMLNLGDLYSEMGNYPKAEAYYLQTLEIQKKAMGESHHGFAASMSNLGSLYQEMDNYPKAEAYQLQALEILKKALGDAHPDVATSMSSLGRLYMDMGDYQKAEPYHLKAIEIRKKALGESHPDVAVSMNNLGNLNWNKGNYPKAEGYFIGWNAKKLAQIQRYFPFLSDHEKEKFYETNLSDKQEIFKSFCVERYSGKKAISIDLFNDQLATKGLLLNSSAKWKHRIKTAGDKKLNRLYDDWEVSQINLNKLLQSTDSTERTGLDSVQAKTEKMEKELSLRSENFAKLADKKLVNWKEVQKTLKPGEAAIEMVRVKKFGIEKTVTDTSDPKKPTYKVKGLTDTIYYAALIVKPESLIPEMVLLKNGNDLEGKHLKFYQNAVSKQLQDNQSYQKFWEKIGTKLGGSTRVYFSPDGVFHNINLNTLFNPKTKKYLLEEKDIRLVTVTKDLVNPGPVEEDNKLAELVGFPNYYANGPTASISTTDRKSPQMTYGLRLDSTGTLAELPGTKTEVDKIAGVLEGKGWEVKNYTGGNALEQNIKESYKPRLLHIATHGFFQPDSTKGSNPLLHSGLMLAGAGSTLKGEKNEGEDGILTAYEAMNLNLDNTDLVVLSACETGLGEIKNGEGVYGLQRAFKVAGARSIIMSLWKVDDEATQELMVSFYKNWLGSQLPESSKLSGSSKRAAFLKAQKELKAKYPNPYYWGAFVMLGE